MQHRTRIIAAITAATVALAAFILPVTAAATYPFQPTDTEMANALSYLDSQQTTDGAIGSFGDSAWVAMAIAAADEDPHDWQEGGTSLVDYLAAHAADATSSADYSRMILAIVAAGEDPTAFGGRDFVTLLEGTYDDVSGQIGDESYVNDDAFGVMALIAAGRTAADPIISDAVDFMLINQNGDDGWGYTVGSASDVDMTSAVIMGLLAGGESAGDSAISGALAYIKSTQQTNGGFESFSSTNAETNAWAISAIKACGQDPNGTAWTSTGINTPVDDLLTCQQAGGEFYFQPGSAGAWVPQTTAKAVIALLGEFYPVVALEPGDGDGVAIDVRIEGEHNTIWSGRVTVSESTITATNSGTPYYYEDPTALGALDEAAQAGGFSYETTDQWGSPFIIAIGGEAGSDTSAWLYRVDYFSAGVGAGDFILGENSPPTPPHGEVLFYYITDNNWSALPLRLEVNDTDPDVGDTFTVTVSEYSDDTNDWSPCEGATVYADASYTTNASGTVDITVNQDATLHIYAEKASYIRSNNVEVIVGTGAAGTGEIGLSANIIPAISITVDPSSIDFGELGPRDTSAVHGLTLTNIGAWDVAVTCDVSGAAGDLYYDGLNINSAPWDEFSETIARDAYADCAVTLTVPETYSGTGRQNGTVIFWAAEAP